MTKIVQILFLVMILTISCKQNVKETTSAELNPERTATYYEELYKFFHAYPETQAQKDENAIIDYIAANKLKPKRSSSGLYYQILDEGYGANLRPGDEVTVHYIGTFLDTKFFDSTYSRGEPIKFKIGQMIPGWNDGFTHLKPGSRAIFIIPSGLAYGENGFEKFVPPNTPLVYEITIVE